MSLVKDVLRALTKYCICRSANASDLGRMNTAWLAKLGDHDEMEKIVALIPKDISKEFALGVINGLSISIAINGDAEFDGRISTRVDRIIATLTAAVASYAINIKDNNAEVSKNGELPGWLKRLREPSVN